MMVDTDIRDFTDSEQVLFCALSVSVPGFGQIVSAVGLRATFSLLFLFGGRTLEVPSVPEVLQTISIVQPVLEHRRTGEPLSSLARRYGVSLKRLRLVAAATLPQLEELDKLRQEVDKTTSRRKRKRSNPTFT